MLGQEASVDETTVELLVGTISGDSHSVVATGTWSVRDVKDGITAITQIPCSEQRLLFGSRVLKDAEVLREFLPANKTQYDVLLVVCIDEAKADIITSLVLGNLSLKAVEQKYQEDSDVVEAAVRKNGMDLEYAGRELRKDRYLVLAAVAQNGFALSFASEAYASDLEAVLLAVQSSSFAITLAHASLQNDCDFAIRAVRSNPFAREYLEPCILRNPAFQQQFELNKNEKARVDRSVDFGKGEAAAAAIAAEERNAMKHCGCCVPRLLRSLLPKKKYTASEKTHLV